MERVTKYYEEQTEEIKDIFSNNGVQHTVKIMLFEYSKSLQEENKRLEDKNYELLQSLTVLKTENTNIEDRLKKVEEELNEERESNEVFEKENERLIQLLNN